MHDPALNRWRRNAAPVLLALLLAVLFVQATSFLDGGPGVAADRLWSMPRKPLLNALPGILLALFFFALSRRLLLSFWLAFLGEALVYGVNTLKIANLATPLMPNDFRMLGQLEGGGHLLASYLPSTPWPYLIGVAGVLLTVLLARVEPAMPPRRAWLRGIVGVAALAALVSLFLPLRAWSHLYDRGKLGLQPWSASNTAKSAGLISTLALFQLEYAGTTHHADTARVEQLLHDMAPQLRARMAMPPMDGPLPDIVVIQSESFVDPGILKGYPASAFVPQLTRLERSGESGRMHIPTFGGGTIRTEFEVLTGISLRYFPEVLFPYLQFQQKEIPSLPRMLQRHGYTTTALHANRPEFWNRTAAFKALGFQRFLSIGDFPVDDQALDGRYVSDKAMTDEILRQLKDDGPPQFLFAISIEAHGPYDYNPNIDTAERDAIPVPATITDFAKVELQNFIYHLRHADAELGRLADALARRQRPTVLMFYGDHLPALVPSFQAGGFDDDGDFFSQTVPWLLLEPNRPQAARRLDNLAAWSVSDVLLQRAGIHDDPWFALTGAVAPRLARLSRAPDAPQLDPGADAELDTAMQNATWMRLHGKFDALYDASTASHP